MSARRSVDGEKERLRLALTKAAAAHHAISAIIRALPISAGIELAGAHSLAFCAERDARAALEQAKPAALTRLDRASEAFAKRVP